MTKIIKDDLKKTIENLSEDRKNELLFDLLLDSIETESGYDYIFNGEDIEFYNTNTGERI